MADRQIDELSFATDISDATTFAANNNAATYEAQQVSVGQIATFMGARADAVHNLGDLHYNKSNLAIDNPGAVPGWTGEYVTNANNVYPDLYTWLKTSHPELCITRSAYDAAITADGECRYFVVDEESGSIRFPKYTYTAPDYPWIYCFNAAVPQTTTQGAEYTTSLISKVSKAGDTMTGTLKMSGENEVRFGTDDNYYYVQKNPNGDFNILIGPAGFYLAAGDNYKPYYTNGTQHHRLLTTADSVLGKAMGEVYYSQSKLAADNPGALPLFTGETIASANTIYPDFYNWVSNHPSLCCTLDSYNASIKTFGECPKYVVGNDEIALPVAWDPSKANLSEAFDYYTDFALLELDGKTYVNVNLDSVMYYTANKNISTDSVTQLYTDVELTKKAYIQYKASKTVYTKPIGLQIETIGGITKAYIRTGTAGNYGYLYGTSGVLGFNTTDYTSLSVETGAIKLPLIKNYIKAANPSEGIKNIEAGLPNITGEFKDDHTILKTDGTTSSGAISNVFSSTPGLYGTNRTTTEWGFGFIFDASKSNAIYGKSSTVTPASTTLYPWVAAYTAAIPASTAQAAEFQQALSGKADTNLGNTTPSQSFKEMSVGWGFPDYSTGVKISGSSYTATYKCWLIGTTLVSTLTPQELYVNGHIVGKEEGDYIDVQMPIDVGDVVTVSGGSFNNLFVYAIKGAN